MLHDLFQRMQSTPVKLPSQSANEDAHPVNKSQQPQKTAPVKQPTSKVCEYALNTDRVVWFVKKFFLTCYS